NWAWRLARESALVLVDAEDHSDIADRVRLTLGQDPDLDIADLHVWRIGAASRACIVSIVTHEPRPVDEYRASLAEIPGLDHVTVEVNQCRDARCLG
ncbi:MAG: cation transporter, partial [Thiohalocapsa sp.]|nr:cation transporter [Thiohalocapsa sp.]